MRARKESQSCPPTKRIRLLHTHIVELRFDFLGELLLRDRAPFRLFFFSSQCFFGFTGMDANETRSGFNEGRSEPLPGAGAC